ncbi:MAG: hypothetical protein E6Q97_10885 [Desulfurellales bacterium]|jgi:hypothetical protein|nr:MAG: hypothetical protein E6Q97_10885 [Desulfurellales bacterium]
MNIGSGLTYLIGLLDFAPGLKTKLGAVAAFALAVIAAWNSAAPQLGVDFVIQVPEFVNAVVLALLGVGAANAQKRLTK